MVPLIELGKSQEGRVKGIIIGTLAISLISDYLILLSIVLLEIREILE